MASDKRVARPEAEQNEDTRRLLSEHAIDAGRTAGSDRLTRAGYVSDGNVRQQATAEVQAISAGLAQANNLMRQYNMEAQQGGGNPQDFQNACNAYLSVIQRANKDLYQTNPDGSPVRDPATGARVPSNFNIAVQQERQNLNSEMQALNTAAQQGRPLTAAEMNQFGVNTSDARQAMQQCVQTDMALQDFQRSAGYAEANYGLALIRSSIDTPGAAGAQQQAQGDLVLQKAAQDDPFMMGPPPDPNYMKSYMKVMSEVQPAAAAPGPTGYGPGGEQFPTPGYPQGYPQQGFPPGYRQPGLPPETMPPGTTPGLPPETMPLPGSSQPGVSRSSDKVFQTSNGQKFIADNYGFVLPSGSLEPNSAGFKDPTQFLNAVDQQAHQPLTPQDLQNYQQAIQLADSIDRVTLKQQMDNARGFLASRLNDPTEGAKLQGLLTQESNAQQNMSQQQDTMAQMIPGIVKAGGQNAVNMLNYLRQFNDVNALNTFINDKNNAQAIQAFESLPNGGQFITALEQFTNNKAIVNSLDQQMQQLDPAFYQTRQTLNDQERLYHSSEDARAHLIRALVSNPANQSAQNLQIARTEMLQLVTMDPNLGSDPTIQNYASGLGLTSQQFLAAHNAMISAEGPSAQPTSYMQPGSESQMQPTSTSYAPPQNDSPFPPPKTVTSAAFTNPQITNGAYSDSAPSTYAPAPAPQAPHITLPGETTIGSLNVTPQGQAIINAEYNLLPLVKTDVSLSKQVVQGSNGQETTLDNAFRQMIAGAAGDPNAAAVAEAIYAAALYQTGVKQDLAVATQVMQQAIQDPNLEALYPEARNIEAAVGLTRQPQQRVGMPGYIPTQQPGADAGQGSPNNPFQTNPFSPVTTGDTTGQPAPPAEAPGQPAAPTDNTNPQAAGQQSPAAAEQQLIAQVVPGYKELVQANAIMGDTQHPPDQVMRAADPYFQQAVAGSDKINLAKVNKDFVAVGQQLNALNTEYQAMSPAQQQANPAGVQQMQQQYLKLAQQADVLNALRTEPLQSRLLYAVALNHTADALYKQGDQKGQNKDQLDKQADAMNAKAVDLLKQIGQKDPNYGGDPNLQKLVQGAIEQAGKKQLIDQNSAVALGYGQDATKAVSMANTPFGALGARPLTLTANIAGTALGEVGKIPGVGMLVGGFSGMAPENLLGASPAAAMALAEAKNADAKTGKQIVQQGQLFSKDGLVHGGIDIAAGTGSVYLADKFAPQMVGKLISQDIPADSLPGLAVKLGSSWLLDSAFTKGGDVAAHHILNTDELTTAQWLSHSTASWGATWAVKGIMGKQAQLAENSFKAGTVDAAAAKTAAGTAEGATAEAKLGNLTNNLAETAKTAGKDYSAQMSSRYRFFSPGRYFGKAQVVAGEDGRFAMLSPEQLKNPEVAKLAQSVSKREYLANQLGAVADGKVVPMEQGSRIGSYMNPKNWYNGVMMRPLQVGEDGQLGGTVQDIMARQRLGKTPWIMASGAAAGGIFATADTNPFLVNPATGQNYTLGDTFRNSAINAGWGAVAAGVTAPIAPAVGRFASKWGVEMPLKMTATPITWLADRDAGSILGSKFADGALSAEARQALNKNLMELIGSEGRTGASRALATADKTAVEKLFSGVQLPDSADQTKLAKLVGDEIKGWKAAFSVPATRLVEKTGINPFRQRAGAFLYERVPQALNDAWDRVGNFTWARGDAGALAPDAAAATMPDGQAAAALNPMDRVAGVRDRVANWFSNPELTRGQIMGITPIESETDAAGQVVPKAFAAPSFQNYMNNMTRVYAYPFALPIATAAGSGYDYFLWNRLDKQSDQILAATRAQQAKDAAKQNAQNAQQQPGAPTKPGG